MKKFIKLIIFPCIILFGCKNVDGDEAVPIFLEIINNSNPSSIEAGTIHDKDNGDNMNITVTDTGGELVIACINKNGNSFNNKIINLNHVKLEDYTWIQTPDNEYSNEWVRAVFKDSKLYLTFSTTFNFNEPQKVSLNIHTIVGASVVTITRMP